MSQERRFVICGIIGGGFGGIVGAYIGNQYGLALGFNPWVIAFFTGIFAIGFAVILTKFIK
jgi:hypothetical protein